MKRKRKKIVIEVDNNLKAYKSIRKPTHKPGSAMRDKKNDYKRKPKHPNSEQE